MNEQPKPIFDITVKSNSKVARKNNQQGFFIHFILKATPTKLVHRFEMEEITLRGPLNTKQQLKQCYYLKKLVIAITPQYEKVWTKTTAKPNDSNGIEIHYNPDHRGGRSWCHIMDRSDSRVERKFDNHLVEYEWQDGPEPKTYMITLRLLLGCPGWRYLPNKEKPEDLVHYIILMVESVGEHPSTKLSLPPTECSWHVSKKIRETATNLINNFENSAHSSWLRCTKDNRECCGIAGGICTLKEEEKLINFCYQNLSKSTNTPNIYCPLYQ